MKYFLAACLLLTAVACSKPDPNDKVRLLRRDFKIEPADFIVDPNTDEIKIDLPVQNLTGGKELLDLTILIEAFDAEGNVFWSKRETLDVSHVGNYSTEHYNFTFPVENANEKLDALNIRLAPDNDGSGYEQYREFMRVAK